MAAPTKDIYVWAEQDVTLPVANRPNKKKPQDSLIQTGWDLSQKPAADEWNDLLNRITLWIKYFKDSTDSPFLQKANNLSDLADVIASRSNLDVFSTSEVNAKKILAGVGLSGGGDFSSDRTISMATPSTVGAGSTNSATNSGSPTHSHALDVTSNVVVLTGTVTNGGTIPLPSGFIESQCKWTAAVASVPNAGSGSDGDFSISLSGRVVSMLFDGTPAPAGMTANYIIVGVK